MSTKRRTQHGFTLIEMMVVVVIIAILSAFLVSVSGATYGGNGQTISDQVVSALNLCKLRAISTRHWHRCEVTGAAPADTETASGIAATTSSITVYEWSELGMKRPTAGACSTTPAVTNCWSQVERDPFPTGAFVWTGTTALYATAGSAPTPTQDTTLQFDIDFAPDGSSTGGTLFVSDQQGQHPYRVFVYPLTGSPNAGAGF